jgi:hypothetical protein
MSTQNKLVETIKNKAPELGFDRRRNLFTCKEARFVYGLRVERGKYPQIPEYRVVFVRYTLDNEWKDTSPLALSKEYIMPFSLVKKLHLLEDEMSRLRDKVSYLNWLYSPEKTWFYITTDVQLSFVITECIGDILTQFLKLKSQKRRNLAIDD